MKLLNHRINPFWDSDNQEVIEVGYVDINPDFIESVQYLGYEDSYKVVSNMRKTLWGYEREVEKEVLDKTYILYRYVMSSGNTYLFNVNYDVDTKQFI